MPEPQLVLPIADMGQLTALKVEKVIMGVDIYAGTLTRYYSRNWTRVKPHKLNHAAASDAAAPVSEEEQEKKNRVSEEILDAIIRWQGELKGSLSSSYDGNFERWYEDYERDFFSSWLYWDEISALVITAACKATGREVPQKILVGVNYMAHEAVVDCNERYSQMWSLMSGVTVWLPFASKAVFKAQMPDDHMATLSTVEALYSELERINDLIWKADETEVEQWASQSPELPDCVINESHPGHCQSSTDSGDNEVTAAEDASRSGEQDSSEECAAPELCNTDELARHAFAVLWQAAKFARDNSMPLRFHF